jgi:hypothetical protein
MTQHAESVYGREPGTGDETEARANSRASSAGARPCTAKIDPALRRTYSGADCGKGAVYGWSGNKNVGERRMEIVESSQPSRLLPKLDFIKPFEAHNFMEFTLETQGGSARLSQAIYGRALTSLG